MEIRSESAQKRTSVRFLHNFNIVVFNQHKRQLSIKKKILKISDNFMKEVTWGCQKKFFFWLA